MPGSKRDFIPYYCTDFTGKEMRLRKSEKSHEVSLIIIIFFFLNYYALSFHIQMFLEVKMELLLHMYSLSYSVFLVSLSLLLKKPVLSIPNLPPSSSHLFLRSIRIFFSSFFWANNLKVRHSKIEMVNVLR